MPYGRSYRKAKRTVKKYATKRTAKRLGKKVIGKFIPGYNAVSTVDDIMWLGNAAYRHLKPAQVKQTRRARDSAMDRARKRAVKQRGRKRYGVDDWW